VSHRPNPWYHPRRVLASTQLTAILLALVALVSALSLGRLDLSGALWFQVLLAVLVVNGTVCTVVRLPRLTGRFHRDPLHVSGTLAVHLGLFLLLAGLFLSGSLAWRETTPALAVGGTAPLSHAPDLRVRCDGLQVLRDEAGRLRDVRANLTVLAGDAPLAGGIVRVGEPLIVRGVGFHLHGYVAQSEEPAAIVQAVYDPGFLPVVAGAVLGTVGAALALPSQGWTGRPGLRRKTAPSEEAGDGD